MPISFTIDLELLTHARAYRQLDNKPDIEIDLSGIVDRLLDLLERTNNRATFFVVAELAESHPKVIRSIHEFGHEVASHTYTHQVLPEVSENVLETEVVHSKSVLESVIDGKVRGFRAPELDHSRSSLELVHSTYEYDSSAINAIPIPWFYASWNAINGIDPQTVQYEFGSVTQVPIATSPIIKIPVSGAWIRLLGYRFTLFSLRHLQRRGQVPVIYLHPRAFHPIGKSSGLPRRIYHNSGDWTFDVVEKILSEFDSIAVEDLINVLR